MFKNMIWSKTTLCNIVCAVLMLALLICQFMPFWHFGETGEETASIQGYVWFPSDHGDLEKYLETINPDHDINDVLLMPILELALCAVGFCLCLIKANVAWMSAFPVAAGLIGIWGYLGKVVFRAGGNWVLHLILCIAILALGCVALVSGIKEIKESVKE